VSRRGVQVVAEFARIQVDRRWRAEFLRIQLQPCVSAPLRSCHRSRMAKQNVASAILNSVGMPYPNSKRRSETSSYSL